LKTNKKLSMLNKLIQIFLSFS